MSLQRGVFSQTRPGGAQLMQFAWCTDVLLAWLCCCSVACFFHLFFKVAALLVYIFSSLFFDNFIIGATHMQCDCPTLDVSPGYCRPCD